MSDTLTARIERCIDKWNALPRQPRAELSSAVTSVSLGLGELAKMHRTLGSAVDELEEKIATAEEAQVEILAERDIKEP